MCKHKVPVDDGEVDSLDDMMINIRNRLQNLSDTAKQGEKALDQLNGNGQYRSIKRMILELENRVEALESEETDESGTEPSDQ